MYNYWLNIDSAKTQKMLPAELPVFKPSPACYGGYFVTWAVLKNSPHRDQAIKLLMSFNKPDVAEKWGRYTKSPTGIKGNLSTETFGFDKFENYQYKMDHKYGKHKFNVFNTSLFVFGKENENVPNYADSVLLCNMSADKAMKEIRKLLRKK
jgi:ABC-type glycerol-3-phosphate transport system substrate-binding protein